MKEKKFTILGLILILTFSAVLTALPAVTAQGQSKLATHAFIGAIPNPVGVNQETLLHLGVLEYLTKVHLGWEGITVTVEKPNGETQTLGPYRTDSTGGTGDIFVPDMVGTYRLQTHFPEQTVVVYSGSDSYDQTYQASESNVLELVVQEEPLPEYPSAPLPDKYWTRPIDSEHREWNTIAGDWLDGASKGLEGVYVQYNDYAPETAHILWAKPYAIGGLAGGALGGHGYEDGDAYQGYGEGSVIIDGIYIYNEAALSTSWGLWETQWNKITAIDIHTGEVLWSKNVPAQERVTHAQTMLWDSFNNHGAFAYVFTSVGSTWNAYDPRTGQWVFSIENVPRGTRTRGPKGEILIYQVDTQNGWMALWNSTNIPALYGADVHPSNPTYNTERLLYTVWGNWWPWNKTVDGTGMVDVSPDQPLGKAGYSWNVTLPTNLEGSLQAVSVGDRAFGASFSQTEVSSWTVSLEKGNRGTVIYSNTWQAPSEWLDDNIAIRHIVISFEDNAFAIFAQQMRTWYAFSMNTGDFLWKTDPQVYLDSYQYNNHGASAYGNLYSVSIGGILYCYDWDNGNLKWTYKATDHYNEFNWGANWAMMTQFITDGKIYLGHEMHSPIDPKPRGAPFVCLDAVTGDVIWRANSMFRQTEWGGSAIIGDSIMVTVDTYDNRLYAVGKGQSYISIDSDASTALGSKTTISGTVMDGSVGTNDPELALKFPEGVPAISDEHMSDWMSYVYKDFERPDATGVTVKLDAVDPNGNLQNLGTTTSDSYGNFGIVFDPEMEGQYRLIATFEGSESYYGSTTTGYITVNPAPTPATPIEPETSLISTEVAIIAAVAVAAVIGVAAYWFLKRK